jgi:hypothetical protein
VDFKNRGKLRNRTINVFRASHSFKRTARGLRFSIMPGEDVDLMDLTLRVVPG